MAHRIGELLAEYGVGVTKLVMPTRQNLQVFENVLVTAAALVEMKRQVERVEQEIRTLKAQKEGGWVIFVASDIRPLETLVLVLAVPWLIRTLSLRARL